MKKIIIALVVLSLTSCTHTDDKPAWMVQREKQEALAKEQMPAIKAEIEQLEGHPWAGHYSTGGGLSGSVVYLAPEAGFVFLKWADIGSDWYRGQCTYENGRIKLTYVMPEDEYASKRMPEELVLVRWGGRNYLLSGRLVGNIQYFCDSIIRGSEPNLGGYMRCGFLLREGDRDKPVEGLPEFPEGYEKYAEFLRENVVDAKILEVGEAEVVPTEENVVEYRIPITIDKGKDAYLSAENAYISSNIIWQARIQFTEIAARQAKGHFVFQVYSEDTLLKAGESTDIQPDRRLLIVSE